jgi:hypothetical protein
MIYIVLQVRTGRQELKGNEPGQFAVHVVLGHAEGLGHVLEGEAAVRLEQLRVSLDLHLADVEGVVGVGVPVRRLY